MMFCAVKLEALVGDLTQTAFSVASEAERVVLTAFVQPHITAHIERY